jgi:outer membrane biosynthesis protein TonB
VIWIFIFLGLALQLFCQKWLAEYKASENYLPIRRVLSIYPVEAHSAHIEGSCTVIFDVDSRGFVKENKEIIYSPQGYFEEAANRGISAFKYHPFTVEGAQ